MKTELDRIKGTLKAYPNGIDINKMVQTEMTLAVMELCAPEGDLSKAFLLLQNYSLIGRINDARETAFLQKAHICLKQCSSKQNWLRLLESYREIDEAYRLYNITEVTTNDKTVLKLSRNNDTAIEPNRADTYISYIKAYHEERQAARIASDGTYSYYIKGSDTPPVEVTIPKIGEIPARSYEPKSKRKHICVTIDELKNSACEIKSLLPKDHSYDVLQSNLIKEVCENEVRPAQQFDISEAVDLVGMVGAGKSTLMKVLTYRLAKQRKKIVIVLDTISEVLKTVGYFRRLNISASPLIGRGNREKYIDQMSIPDEMYLDPLYSEYLTTPCIISGMSNSDGAVPKFGEEPCRSLKKGRSYYTCPYIDICPTTRMYREIYTSDVIVTTVQGLTAVKIIGSGQLFLEYVLEQTDLVIFDECDKVQKTLDEFFTPCTDFLEFMKSNADACAKDMKRDAASQDAMDENERCYSTARNQSFEVSLRVREAIQSIEDPWKYMLRETFSAMTLYHRLCEESENGKNKLTPKILTMLETAMDTPKDDELDTILDIALQLENDEKFTRKLKKWLSKNGCEADIVLLKHIKLYLILTGFDNYIKSLETAYSYLSDENKDKTELFDFLQARFTAQQKFLPSSVMGNLFGMRNDPKRGLQLYRQYAFGRALMNRMPYLRLENDGSPAGPHVLLMSGSSWAPGCLEYHVNVPVKYILEAEPWKRDKLCETEMIDLYTGVRVSGTGADERTGNLRLVIQKIIETVRAELNKGRKLLMIVNSYNEAITAEKALNELLDGKPAACMVRSKGTDDIELNTQVLRANVHGFDSHRAKILVAPAQAIERGYNIVDKDGHSVFGSIFFLVRPMPVPNEISSKCAKLNGLAEQRAMSDSMSNGYKKADNLRGYAARQWRQMEVESRKTLRYISKTLRRDVTAALFVLILQLFGRLARITDPTKDAPCVYFADGAFHAAESSRGGYDSLNELRYYLNEMMESEQSAAIAASLYEPFYTAFMKGVNENVMYIPDGNDAEDE